MVLIVTEWISNLFCCSVKLGFRPDLSAERIEVFAWIPLTQSTLGLY